MFASMSATLQRDGRRSLERPVLSDIYVRLSSLRARMGPICRLGCQPSPSSQQVFCAVLCVTVSARASFGRGWQIAFEFETSTLSTAQHGSHTCHAQICTRRDALTHTFLAS